MPKTNHDKGFILVAVLLALAVVGAIAYLLNREGAMSLEMAVGEADAARARYVAEAGLAYAEAKMNAAGDCKAPVAPITGNVGGDTFSVTGILVPATPSSPAQVNLTSVAALAGNTGAATITQTKKVMLYTGLTGTLKLLSAPTVQDTFIANKLPNLTNGTANPSSIPPLAANFGGDTELIVDNGGKAGPILIKFNLAPNPLPANVKLLNAYLGLTFKSANNTSASGKPQQLSDITAHAITTAWDEGAGLVSNPSLIGSSYQFAKLFTLWESSMNISTASGTLTSPAFIPYLAPGTNTTGGIPNAFGGDYDPAYVGLMERKTSNPTSPPIATDIYIPAQLDTYNFVSSQYVRWNISPLVAEWLAGNANNGVLLKAEQALGRAAFYSSEEIDQSKRPTLTLTYQAPCGAVSPALIADTYLNSTDSATTQTYNYGAGTTLNAQKSKQKHALIRFANLGIPTTSLVTSAKLRLYVTNIITRTPNTDLQMTVNPLITDWVEGTGSDSGITNFSTWLNKNSTTQWANKGGDFGAAVANYTFSRLTTPGSWIEIPVTPLVQSWVTTPASNFGFIVGVATSTNSGSDEIQFASKETALGPQFAPQLIVTYQ